MISSIFHLIVYTLMSVLLFFIVMRFLLQLVRADFYNPVSQGIVKGTQPLLRPFRKIIPGFWGIDLASVVLILIVQYLATTLLLLTLGLYILSVNPLVVLLWGTLGAVTYVSGIIFIALIVSIVGSFIPQISYHPLFNLAGQIVEPLARPFRKLIPPLGGVLDISPIFVFLVLKIVNMLVDSAAVYLQLVPKVVIGFW
jgi:YggT family protein